MMTEILAQPAVVLLLQGSLFLILGGIVGLGYFRAVRLSADLFARRRYTALAIALTLARLLLVGGLLVLVVREGALPLLAFALGFFGARVLATRRALVST
jgi:hypothetical protein